MAILEVSLSFVDTYAASPTPLKASVALIFACFFLQIISLALPHWIDMNDDLYDGSVGLWKYCWEDDKFTCCEAIEKQLYDVQSSWPDWYHGARALQVLGLMTSVASAILTTFSIGTTTQRSKSILLYISVFVNEVTGLLILTSVMLYGTKYRYNSWLNQGFLSASYGVSTTAGIVFIFIGILVAIGGCFQRDVQQSGNNCIVCMERPIEMVFIPCYHSNCCSQCHSQIQRENNECPTCRETISRFHRVYQ